MTTCLYDQGCVGFAISGELASSVEPMKPNRCFVYGKISEKPYGWKEYSQKHFDVYTISSEQPDTRCLKIGNSKVSCQYHFDRYYLPTSISLNTYSQFKFNK